MPPIKNPNFKNFVAAFILMLFIPVVTGVLSFLKSDAVISERVAVIKTEMAGGVLLIDEKIYNMEKMRAQQYQYIEKQTGDIKDRLDIMQGISMIQMYDTNNFWFATRSHWIDSSNYYTRQADNSFFNIVMNCQSINMKLDNAVF